MQPSKKHFRREHTAEPSIVLQHLENQTRFPLSRVPYRVAANGKPDVCPISNTSERQVCSCSTDAPAVSLDS